MANKNLFNTKTAHHTRVPHADAVNAAGGVAYQLSHKHQLAQLAATGMLGNTFYATAGEQLQLALDLARKVPVEFLAQVAVYSRKRAYLKDMPALLLAVLATRDPKLFRETFFGVVDNGRMLRNFVQIMRSGRVGRTSLGSAPKKMIEAWLDRASDEYLFKASVGNNPSLTDIIKMVHPKPKTKSREALYRYLLGLDLKGYRRALPQIVKDFEKFKKASKKDRSVPDVPFQMLTSCDLQPSDWRQLAEKGAWQFTRMNLNNFSKRDLFEDSSFTKMIADRLGDEKTIQKARQYPYQVLTSYLNANNVPAAIQTALAKAVEVAAGNIPAIEGKLAIFCDTSGSMGASASYGSAVTCRDIAGLFAACLVRKNPDARVYSVDTKSVRTKMSHLDSIFTNSDRINAAGGGTALSVGFDQLVAEKYVPDVVIIISDNMSWADYRYPGMRGTRMMHKFADLRKKNKNAKLVLIDITPFEHSQAPNEKHILNVGGFSDQVFDVVSSFLKTDASTGDYWVKKIEEFAKSGSA